MNNARKPMERLELLYRALVKAPSKVTVRSLARSLIEVRRASRKRGPDARLAITDQMAKELRSTEPGDRPVYLLVGIPRELAVELEAAKAVEDSPIIRPGLVVPG
jgi:hypothetical protein